MMTPRSITLQTAGVPHTVKTLRIDDQADLGEIDDRMNVPQDDRIQGPQDDPHRDIQTKRAGPPDALKARRSPLDLIKTSGRHPRLNSNRNHINNKTGRWGTTTIPVRI